MFYSIMEALCSEYILVDGYQYSVIVGQLCCDIFMGMQYLIVSSRFLLYLCVVMSYMGRAFFMAMLYLFVVMSYMGRAFFMAFMVFAIVHVDENSLEYSHLSYPFTAHSYCGLCLIYLSLSLLREFLMDTQTEQVILGHILRILYYQFTFKQVSKLLSGWTNETLCILQVALALFDSLDVDRYGVSGIFSSMDEKFMIHMSLSCKDRG